MRNFYSTVQMLLVKHRSGAVYHGIPHESIVFSRHTHKPLGKCVNQENTTDKWRRRCVNNSHQALDNQTEETNDKYEAREKVCMQHSHN